MNVYILRMIGIVNYNEYDAKVVVAKNEIRARELANAQPGGEGKIWQDKEMVSCNKVNKQVEGAVLASFNAG